MNLTNMLKYSELLENKNSIKKIFFYRVCGVGMGAAACLLKEQGYNVEGGDISFSPPMSDYLEKTKIKLHKLDSMDKSYLNNFDLIVVGNVVPKEGKDASIIEDSGIKFCSFPSALGAFVLSEKNVVGISGTHGKTTTAFFMTQIFENMGFRPGYFVGGVIEGRPSSTAGDGNYFFIESDEYDSAYFEKISKFRLYSIKHLIITSLEFDHADIFSSLEDIKDQFRALIPEVKKSYILNSDYEAINELRAEFKLKETGRVTIYGEKAIAGPQIIKSNSSGTDFILNYNGLDLEFNTNIVGIHNILNISTCILFALNENIDYQKINEAIKNLRMVKRRQEIRGKYKESLIIDDFAHHPRAVSVTVDAIKTRFPDKAITAIIEPYSATARSSIFQDEFASSLSGAKNVIIVRPIKSTTVKNYEDLDCDKLVIGLKDKVDSVCIVKEVEELINKFAEFADRKNLFLILSNGNLLGIWQSKFVDSID